MEIPEGSKEVHRRLSPWWLVGIGLVVVFAIIGLLSRPRHAGSDPNGVLREMVIRGIQANISGLSSAMLVWHSESKGLGPWSGKPELVGDHQLWWDGRRTAISYTMRSTTRDPNGHVSSNLRARFLTYDGREFRRVELPTMATGKAEMAIQRKPHYRPSENHLTDIGWLGHGLISSICGRSVPTEPGTLRYSQQGQLIQEEFHNRRTGQIGVVTYDGEKAYGLVTRENYAQAGKIQSRTTIRYEQVPGGAWFPVRVVTEGYSIQTGELIHQSKVEVDVDKSVFNHPAAFPEDIFELKAGPNTDVTDLTSLTTRLKRLMNAI
jgi:hypothetical protein